MSFSIWIRTAQKFVLVVVLRPRNLVGALQLSDLRAQVDVARREVVLAKRVGSA
jgi:hypothetical protein